MSAPTPTTAVFGAGVFLSPAACSTLDRLIEQGIDAMERVNGGRPQVPPGTEQLLELLRNGKRLRAGQGPDLLGVGSASSASRAHTSAPKAPFLTVAEVAQRSGVSAEYVRRLARRRQIKGARREGLAWTFPAGTVVERSTR